MMFNKADVKMVKMPTAFNPPAGYETFDYMGQTFVNKQIKLSDIKGIPHICCTEWNAGGVGPTLPAIGFANETGGNAEYWVFPWNAGSLRDEVYAAFRAGTYGKSGDEVGEFETELTDYPGDGYVNYLALQELLAKRSDAYIHIEKDRHYQIELHGNFTAEELKAVIALHEGGIDFKGGTN